MKNTLLASLLLTLAAAAAAHAQAPAGAPAGANGICKDGTYSMQATKDGACRGHKGVQTWYLATTAKPAAAPAPAAMPAPSTAASAPSRPAPTPAAAAPAAMPAPAPAAAAKTSSRPGPAASAAGKTAAPGGGPGLVWLNTASNVYHCPGTTYYGKTKAGAYMSEADAKAKGAHNEGGKPCPAQ
jgi:hypothetical protein